MATNVNATTRIYADSDWSTSVREIRWVYHLEPPDTTVSGAVVAGINGRIIGIKSMPNSTQYPKNNHRIEIRDAVNNMDVLNHVGSGLSSASTAVSNIRCPFDYTNGSPIPLVNETLRFWGSAMTTSAKSADGAFSIYVESF